MSLEIHLFLLDQIFEFKLNIFKVFPDDTLDFIGVYHLFFFDLGLFLPSFINLAEGLSIYSVD
jgi:hypothetical protein